MNMITTVLPAGVPRVVSNNNTSSTVAEMGDRLTTIGMTRKVGGGLLCPFPWVSLVLT